MSRRIVYVSIIIFTVLLGSTLSLTLGKGRETREMPRAVSLVNLIATPERFDNTKVVVVGFASIEFEGTHLYLSVEDYRHGILKNSIWLDLDPRKYAKFHEKYVLVEGIFDKDSLGHMGVASGSIDRISRLMEWRFRR